EVEDIAVERPHIDFLVYESLNNTAGIEETADDLPVLRVRVLREKKSSPGEVARLRVLERVAGNAAEGVLERLEGSVGADRDVAHIDRFALVARRARLRGGEHDRRGLAERCRQAAHLHYAEVVACPEVGKELGRSVLDELHRDTRFARGPADDRAPGCRRRGRHGVHAGVRSEHQSALIFALRTTSPQRSYSALIRFASSAGGSPRRSAPIAATRPRTSDISSAFAVF